MERSKHRSQNFMYGMISWLNLLQIIGWNWNSTYFKFDLICNKGEMWSFWSNCYRHHFQRRRKYRKRWSNSSCRIIFCFVVHGVYTILYSKAARKMPKILKSWSSTKQQATGSYFPSKRRVRWLAPFTRKTSSSTSSSVRSNAGFCLFWGKNNECDQSVDKRIFVVLRQIWERWGVHENRREHWLFKLWSHVNSHIL